MDNNCATATGLKRDLNSTISMRFVFAIYIAAHQLVAMPRGFTKKIWLLKVVFCICDFISAIRGKYTYVYCHFNDSSYFISSFVLSAFFFIFQFVNNDNFVPFQVHLVSEHIWCDDYLVRSFYLKNQRTGETRTVTQFHFLSWPENGVPSSTKALLEFRRFVNITIKC